MRPIVDNKCHRLEVNGVVVYYVIPAELMQELERLGVIKLGPVEATSSTSWNLDHILELAKEKATWRPGGV